MNYIINPLTGDKLPLLSDEGRQLLKFYIKLYQSGGANSAGKIKIFDSKQIKKKSKQLEKKVKEFNRIVNTDFNKMLSLFNESTKIPVASTKFKIGLKTYTPHTNIILGMVKNIDNIDGDNSGPSIHKENPIPLFSMTTKGNPEILNEYDYVCGKIDGAKDTGFSTFEAWKPRIELFVAKAIKFLKQGRDIFIGCQQGKDRSVLFATIVIGVLCKVDRETAFRYIKYYRPFVTTDSFPDQWKYIKETIERMSKYSDEKLAEMGEQKIPRYNEMEQEIGFSKEVATIPTGKSATGKSATGKSATDVSTKSNKSKSKKDDSWHLVNSDDYK